VTTVAGAIPQATARLARAGVESPGVDAEILLAHVLGTTRSALRAEGGRDLDIKEREALGRLLARRATREPLAYVLGEWGFRRLVLNVDRRVLVPRPETEIVVERCLLRLAGRDEPRVLDVGTGSGAIAFAIVNEHPGARVTGMDASAPALEVARENAARTGLPVELVEGDLFAGLPAGPWDLVVANPPYVSPGDMESLPPEVRDWEPREALVGEGATDAIAEGARAVLRPSGALILEVADGAAARVSNLLRELGYSGVETTRDLTGRDRVVEGRL
jgi:release factor glutamine methyltransferase